MEDKACRMTERSQSLRKNMTKEERHLWYDFLSRLKIRFKRQKVLGSYILDFYCEKEKLAIELDGSQHFEQEGIEKDKKRDAFLKEHGITVLRYSNHDVNYNFYAVCEDIWNHLSEKEFVK